MFDNRISNDKKLPKKIEKKRNYRRKKRDGNVKKLGNVIKIKISHIWVEKKTIGSILNHKHNMKKGFVILDYLL